VSSEAPHRTSIGTVVVGSINEDVVLRGSVFALNLCRGRGIACGSPGTAPRLRPPLLLRSDAELALGSRPA
jgi:hypothetical protein